MSTPPDSTDGTPLTLPPDVESAADIKTVRDLIAGMPHVFNPEAAEGIEGVIQFRLTGEEEGDYYIVISSGSATSYEGIHPEPTLTINAPSEVWVAIGRGELNGPMAFLKKMFTVSGDVQLLLNLEKMFNSKT